jgi:NAD(P)-dependent dehydrogenase (short-subunit alcohol dehydrogenase family)
MSLVGQTVWIVGGVGVVGRGIARGLLQAGATVIVNSRSEERLDRILQDLQHPSRLIAIHGSLQPEQAQETVARALQQPEILSASDGLHHVVAHGAVRYWSTLQAGCDETFSLTKPKNKHFLDLTSQEFLLASSTLAQMHFAAAQQLVPLLQKPKSNNNNQHQYVQSTYTFVTGDGGGHPSSLRTPMGELNSHHVWGLSAALRRELQNDPSVWMRELRVGMQVNRPLDVREADPRTRPLSEDIGDLVAGLVVTAQQDHEAAQSSSFLRTFAKEKADGLIRIDSGADLERLLKEYQADTDKNIGPLPSIAEFAGSL